MIQLSHFINLTGKRREVGGECLTVSGSIVMIQQGNVILQERNRRQLHTTGKSTPFINIYISFAPTPKDQTLLGELEGQLAMLKREPDICFWDKRSIIPGKNRQDEIATHIKQAHLILLLLSPDYLASEECYAEMVQATNRADKGETHVIPILMRPSSGWQGTPIGQLEPLPTDQEPVSNRADQGKALSDIAESIRRVVETIRHDLSGSARLYASPAQPAKLPSYASPPLAQPSNVRSYAPSAQPSNFPSGPNFAPPPVRPKQKVGLIFALVVIVVLAIVIIIGRTVLVPGLFPSTLGDKESPRNTDPAPSSIVTNIQVASAIDPVSMEPTTLATSFKTHTNIYTTFRLNLKDVDINPQHPGYIQARYYNQNKNMFTDHERKRIDDKTISGGYFTFQYYNPTTSGAVKLYWCRHSDCSDAKFAQTASFTVS